ncbi:hypothetical protein HYH02_004528 [Chlamydomonas schloesseri]|uniref:Protein kinase domain-containing protein n=1 Tax=Chlamydomonas schloesseri TaxID=2026947 RepID=A0A835WMT4_9CHLO|nr:hypothetical protein HYH02_004528 [Chlamydomonas schloesseri]|eukprot:KAG2450689.1 hypothetical protein HYH02_004528 [Chlamydomonas schloesseri]
MSSAEVAPGCGWVFCSTSGAAATMHPLCAPHHAAWITSLRDSLHYCKQEAGTLMGAPRVAGAYMAAAGAAAATQRAVVVAQRLADALMNDNALLPPAAAAVSAALAAASAPIVSVQPLPLSLSRPGELLALPIFHMRGGRDCLTAVLLLGGLCAGGGSSSSNVLLDGGMTVAAAAAVAGEQHQSQQQLGAAQRLSASQQQCQQHQLLPPPPQKLGSAEYRELQRLAQFIGFGLFADPSQALFLSQVAAHLAAISASHGLHDAIVAVLDNVPELIRSRTSVAGRPLLAACTAPLPPPTPGGHQHTQAGGGGGMGSSGTTASTPGASAVQQVDLLKSAPADISRAVAAAAAGAISAAAAETDGAPSAGATSTSGAGANPVVVFAHRSGAAALCPGTPQDASSHAAAASAAGVIGGSAGANANANASPFQSASTSNLPAVNNSLFARLPNSPLGGAAPAAGGPPDSGAVARPQRVHSVSSMRALAGVVSDSDGAMSGPVKAAAAAVAAAPEPSRIKAVRMQLPRSLLYKAIKASSSQHTHPQQPSPQLMMPASFLAAPRPPQGVHATSLSTVPGGSQRQGSQQYQQLAAGRLRTGTAVAGPGASSAVLSAPPSSAAASAAACGPFPAASVLGSTAGVGGGGGIRHLLSALTLATGRAPASTMTLSDASAHVLEDSHALRDVLLAGNLLGGVSPGAVVVCVEGPPLPPPIMMGCAALAYAGAAAASGAAGLSGVGGVAGTATIATGGTGLLSNTGTISSTGGGYISTTASALLTTHSIPAAQNAAGSVPLAAAASALPGSAFCRSLWSPPPAQMAADDEAAAGAPAAAVAAGAGPLPSSGAANFGDVTTSQVLAKQASASALRADTVPPHGGGAANINRPSVLSMLATAASYGGSGGYVSNHPSAGQAACGSAGQAASGMAPTSARVLAPSAAATGSNINFVPAGMQAGLPVVTAPAPGRLALYLVFEEALPAGMLQMVESELKQLMPMVFACFRAVLSGGNFCPVPYMPYGTPLITLARPPYSRVPSDWRLLYEQVTGRTVPLPSLATTFSGVGAAGGAQQPLPLGGAVLSRMISGLETVSELDSQILERLQHGQHQHLNLNQQQQHSGFGSIMSLGPAGAPSGSDGQLAAMAGAVMAAQQPAAVGPDLAGAGTAGGAAGGAAAAASLYGSGTLRDILTPPLSPLASLGGSASVGTRRPILPSTPTISSTADQAGSSGGGGGGGGGGGAGGASAGSALGGSTLLSSPRAAAVAAGRQVSAGSKSRGGPLSFGEARSSGGGGAGTASLAAALKRRLTERSASGGAFKALLGLGAPGGGSGRISGVVPATATGAGAAPASAGGGVQLPGAAAGGGGIAGFVSGLNAFGVGGGVGLFGVGQMDTAPVDAVQELKGGSASNAANWLYKSSPEVQLEEALQAAAAAAATASGSVPRSASMAAQRQQQSTELLVSTVRSRLTAALAGSEDTEQARTALQQDLEAIELLDVLGRGGQGVVFRGTMHGLETAIKVFAQNQTNTNQAEQDKQAAALKAKEREKERQRARNNNDPMAADSSDGEVHSGGEAAEGLSRQAKRGAMEVAVSQIITHPSIVQVYAAFNGVVVVRCHYRDSPVPVLRLCTPDDAMLGNSDPGPLNQVLCMEYCDAGTLLAASRSGAFRLPFATGPANGAIWPALVPLYTSLLEVALALRHLHSRRLVHCDVKAANVLLKSSTRDPRGWNCKLSDFGCVRLMNDAGPDGAFGFRVTHPLGTVGHMAPECFVKGALLGASVDVYALGIMMYELLMCRTPYSNMNPQDVPRQVLRSGLRPVFHPLAPAPYVSLAARCWSASPRRRPTASELVAALQGLLADAQATAADAAAAGGGAGPGSRGAGTAARPQQPFAGPPAPAAAAPAAPSASAAAPPLGRGVGAARGPAGAGAAAAGLQPAAHSPRFNIGPLPAARPGAFRAQAQPQPAGNNALLPEPFP